METCSTCSSFSYPSAAPCARALEPYSAPTAETRSCGCTSRSANAAGLRVRGRSAAAPSAQAVGSRSHGRAPRSCTTIRRGGSCASGRSTDGDGSRTRRLSSSPWSFPRWRSMLSSTCRATRSGPGGVETSLREDSREHSVKSGGCPRASSSAARAHCRPSAGSRSRTAAGTSATPSSRPVRRRAACASWTTCTRPEQPPTRARRRSGEQAPGTSRW